MRRALVLAILLACSLHALTPAQPPADALRFFQNYFVTGDYAVGGVGLRGLGVGGVATGTIAIEGVPEGADILAAFLYWQVVSKDGLGADSGIMGATFDGHPLYTPTGPLAKVLAPGGTAPCWSSGGGTGASSGQHRTYTYRADVLRFLGIDGDKSRRTFGKFRVNGGHRVQVPDSGPSGNGVPIALGASLVVVYRDPSAPLRAIVLYDGAYTMDQTSESMSQRIRGFYQAATPDATITHIVGSGQANKSERLYVNGVQVAVNPFAAVQGASWDNPTFRVTSPTSLDHVTTSVDHAGFGTFDCLTWGAIVYQTAVRDTDDDGLLDVWESEHGLRDPDGQPLPDLAAMGASPSRRDLFVEVGSMHAGEATAYGGVLKPPHTHLPSAEALKLIGDTFAKAPVHNPDGSSGIAVHFDVGQDFPSGEADPYVVPRELARGGESFDEMVTVCAREPEDPPWVCQFSAYPGTVGWKSGFRFIRDLPLDDAVTEDQCDAFERDGDPNTSCDRVFDRVRKDIFRYAFFAHALGVPKAACLQADGLPDFECQDTNPDYHVPVTNTGVADFPGGDVLVTLGAFDDAAGKPVGTPFMQASTLMHEWGHTFERTHGGETGEPNCKPNYLSVMNYLFQLRGLLDAAGVPRLDYSGRELDPLDETFLVDGQLELPYQTGWYAPQGAATLGAVAKRHCDGSVLSPEEEAARRAGRGMVRIDGEAETAGGELLAVAVDWNADGLLGTAEQDINFDGVLSGARTSTALLRGSADWTRVRLNQLGSRRNVGGWYFVPDPASPGAFVAYMGPLSLNVGRGDLGRGDLGRGDLGRGDLGRGDLGRGDLGRGDLGRGDLGRGDLGRGDLGRGDLGRGDLGRGDLGVGNPDEPSGEVDLDIVVALGNTPPNELRATLIDDGAGGCTGLAPAECHRVRLNWKAPNVGQVVRYRVFRARAEDPTTRTAVGSVGAVTGVVEYSLVDTEELPNATFTYAVLAEFADDDGNPLTPAPVSGPSNLARITVVNDPPAATADTYSTDQGVVLVVTNPGSFGTGVLANDRDVDSPSLGALLVEPAAHGTLVLDANGSFRYAPDPSFVGVDTFGYSARDVDPTRGSEPVVVSIVVRDTTPPLVNLTIPSPNGQAGYFVTTPVWVDVQATDPSSVTAITCTDNGAPREVEELRGMGTPDAGGRLRLTAEGVHYVSCTATDGLGNGGAAAGSANTGGVRIDTRPPDITLTAPADGAVYGLRASASSHYGCMDPVPGSGLAACEGPVPSGSSLDTAAVGPKRFSVRATDVAGNTGTKTHIYTVEYSVTIGALKKSAEQGSAVPVTWQLKDGVGGVISSLGTLLKMESVFNGAVPPGGCVTSATGVRETLYSAPDGSTGNSSLRLTSTQTFQFNWDTTTTQTSPTVTGRGCYTVLIYLDDRPDLANPRLTTPVQLK